MRRVVTDERAGVTGSVSGTLEISDVPAGLSWIETGQLNWIGVAMPITRRLELRPCGPRWDLHFSHGGYFHEWAPGRELQHQCRDDLYVGAYRVTPVRIDVVWTVVGPTKRHRYVTVFER
jgi:hypothetical protein